MRDSSIVLPSSIELDRARVAKGGLYQFVKCGWERLGEGSRFIDARHIRLVCKHLEMVSLGLILRLIINVPPGTGKSLLMNVFWPAWDWILNPWRRWMMTSHDDGLVLRDARRTRRLVESPWYQTRWGPRAKGGSGPPGCAIDVTKTAAATAGEFWTTGGGLRFSTTIGSKGVGWHADIQGFDDPHKPLEASSSALSLERVIEWWDETMSSRAVPGRPFARVGVMQRLDENDLSAHCIAKGYHVLCLPMRFEPDHPYVDEEDWRTDEGELLCPGLKDEAKVEEEGRDMGPVARAAQHQQRPSPRGGAVFKRDWLVRFWRELPSEILVRAQSWDHSFGTVGETSSRVCGQAWGMAPADFYLIDRVSDRCEFPAMKVMIRTFSAKHPDIVTKYIELAADGRPIVQDLKHEISGLVGVQVSGKGSKVARAQAVTGYAEAGNIWLPHPTEARLHGKPHPCPWVHEWIEKVCRFRGLPSDEADDVDTMSQAFMQMRSGGRFSRTMGSMKR